MNIFSEIAKGLTWVGKELLDIPATIKKVITVADDVKTDADTILPEIVTLIDSVDGLVAAAVKDSGADISAAEALVSAITVAVQANAMNFVADAAVLAALKTFATAVTTSSNYTDVLSAIATVVKSYDTLAGTAKTALTKLEADV